MAPMNLVDAFSGSQDSSSPSSAKKHGRSKADPWLDAGVITLAGLGEPSGKT